jgi:hypothetical protein
MRGDYRAQADQADRAVHQSSLRPRFRNHAMVFQHIEPECKVEAIGFNPYIARRLWRALNRFLAAVEVYTVWMDMGKLELTTLDRRLHFVERRSAAGSPFSFFDDDPPSLYRAEGDLRKRKIAGGH